MPKRRVAIVGPPEAAAKLREVLPNVELCPDTEKPDARVVWLTHAAEVGELSGRASYDPTRTFYVLDVNTFSTFTQLFDGIQLHHVRGSRPIDLASLQRDIDWACAEHIPRGKDLAPEACVREWSLTCSDQVDTILRELDEHLTGSPSGSTEPLAPPIHPRLVAQFIDAAGELLTNAVYNAPVDKFGDPMFRFRSRLRAVTLPNQDSITVRLCRSPARVVLSICDPYGSLSSARVVETLRRAHHRNDRQVQPTPGGAGVGMMVALNSVSSLSYSLEPGRACEVIASTEIVPSLREFQQRPRSFSLWASR